MTYLLVFVTGAVFGTATVLTLIALVLSAEDKR